LKFQNFAELEQESQSQKQEQSQRLKKVTLHISGSLMRDLHNVYTQCSGCRRPSVVWKLQYHVVQNCCKP